jgi:hypothetical protein
VGVPQAVCFSQSGPSYPRRSAYGGLLPEGRRNRRRDTSAQATPHVADAYIIPICDNFVTTTLCLVVELTASPQILTLRRERRPPHPRRTAHGGLLPHSYGTGEKRSETTRVPGGRAAGEPPDIDAPLSPLSRLSGRVRHGRFALRVRVCSLAAATWVARFLRTRNL